MMKFICELIIMSISGTVMYGFSVLLRGRKYAAMRYAMLAAAVVIMLVPFNLISFMPKLVRVELPSQISYSTGYAANVETGADIESFVIAAVILIWLLGALISGIGVVRNYIKTTRILKRVTEESYDERILDTYLNVCSMASVRPRAELRVSRYLNSPLLFGVLKPQIIIPSRRFTDTELEMIIAHELIHYKHKDLWIALAAAAAQCVHWFNPFVYLIGTAVTETRELCCDETVLDLLEPEDKKEYGRVIISVIEDGLKRGLAYTTAMASPKESIQKRLLKIVEFRKPSRAVRLVGAAAVCACTVTSLTAFGFTQAAEAVPTQITHQMAQAVRKSPKQTPKAEIEEQTTAAPVIDEGTDTDVVMLDYAESPVYTYEPLPSEQYIDTEAEPEQSEIYEDYKEEDETAAEEAFINEAAAEESQTDDRPSYSFENTAADDTEERESAPQPKTFVLPESAYIFNPDISKGDEVRSDNFYASRDIKLTVRYGAYENAAIAVYDADSGELVHDNGFRSYAPSFSMQMPEGSTYYIVVRGQEENFSIFIIGE